MPFDPQLVEARIALGMIAPEEMPALAADALEAGVDGRRIRRMAALSSTSGWETDQVLPAFMVEAGLRTISISEAALRVARHIARRILNEGLDPLAFTRDFEAIWIRSDYCREIQEAGTLDDDKAVAQYMGRSEDDVREQARQVMLALVASDSGS
jgi:hypothetical protein